MTTVKKGAAALAAALVLALGCMLVLATPQQAQAADTQLVAGTTFARATSLGLNNSALSSSNKTAFNAATDNSFYKFKTSSRRDSTYRLTLRSYESRLIYATIYTASHHRIANIKVSANKNKTWVFQNLTPNSTYYIELWRFATNTSGFVGSGVINGEYQEESGASTYLFVPYKITLKEIVTKPSMPTVKVWTKYNADAKHKHYLKLKWGEPSFSTEAVQIKFWWFDSSGKQHTFYRSATNKNHYTTWTVHWGSSYPYYVQARPYMKVNGKLVYGKWAKMVVYKYNPYYKLSMSTGKYTGKYQWRYSDVHLVKDKQVTTAKGKRWTYKWKKASPCNKKIAKVIIPES